MSCYAKNMDNEGPKNIIKEVSDSMPQQPQSPPDADALMASWEERLKDPALTSEEIEKILIEIDDTESLWSHTEKGKEVNNTPAVNATQTAELEKKSDGAADAANLPKVGEKVEEEDDLNKLFSEEPLQVTKEPTPQSGSVPEEDDLNELFSDFALEQSPEEKKISDMFIELSEIYGYAIPEDVKIDFDGCVFNLKNCDADLKERFTTRLEAFVAEQREKMEKREPSEEIKPPVEPEQPQKEEREGEDTTKERKEKLGDVVDDLEKATREENERKTKLAEEETSRRSEEIDAEAEKMGGVVEKFFRWTGEKYNKLSTREKIGTGLALGLGAGGLMAVSVPVALVFCGGIWVQRVAGAASTFMKYENATLPHDEERKDTFWKWGAKEKAMAKTMGISAAATIGMLVLAEGVEKGVEWLHHYWPDHTEISADAPTAPAQPAAAAAAGESATVASAPEMPAVYAHASPGHGYEYMLKRLWEQLHDNKQLDPSKYAEGSDIHKLLTADAASIDTVVHQIASDSGHGFFNADGTSVQINLDDHIFIAPDGQVHMSHEFYNSGPVQAPENAPVTPAYPPETAPAAPEITPPVGEAATDHLSNKIYSEGSNPSVLHGSADYPLESHTPPIEEFQPDKVTFSHDEVHTRIFPEDGNQEREVLESIKTYADDYTELTVSEDGRILERFMVDPEGHTSRYTGGDTFVPASEDQTADVKNAIEHAHRDEISAPQPEAPAHAQEIIQQSGSGEVIQEHADGIVVNQSGLKIPTDKPHFYAGADDKHIFAYGGGSAEEKLKAIKEFLTQNLDKTVYSADANGEHRIPWHITPQGELVGVPEKTGGIFGWFKSFVKPPEPNEFVKLIK